VRLKITKEKRGIGTVVHIDGQLLAQGLPELKKTLEPEDHVTCLDLEHLISVDAEAIEEIHRMARAGIRLVKASTYIKLLLEAGQDSNDKPFRQSRTS
jgi:hypothetical protein